MDGYDDPAPLEQSLKRPKWVSFESEVPPTAFQVARLQESSSASEENVSDVYRLGATVSGCDAVVVRSCFDFEPDWLNLLKKLYKKPVVPVGLLPAVVNDAGDGCWPEMKQWLDMHPKGSVVYIAFGTETKPNQYELTQLALGYLVEKKMACMVHRDDVDGSFTPESVADSQSLVMVSEDGKMYGEKAKEMMPLFGDINVQDKLKQYGRLMDAYVARKKDLRGNHFGFIRYGDATNVNAVLMQLNRVRDLLTKCGYTESAISFIGGLRLLIAFKYTNQAEEFLKDKKKIWEEAFVDAMKWKGQPIPYERLVELKFTGVPLQYRDDISMGSCLLVTTLGRKINEEIKFISKDGTYSIWATEKECQINSITSPDCFHCPSNSSVSHDQSESNNMEVEGGGIRQPVKKSDRYNLESESSSRMWGSRKNSNGEKIRNYGGNGLD
ncbi:hypothetical protein E3N88_04890 [Mikania micrantha]|uniref:Uncharacterized protein n=1 Tax=Mikania micrantha TaxID=192012 RepID=A0A5N6PW81_9ASTR|nr:hypothetical protein E3N88_04890 [Mikania micrantha]